MRKGYIKPDVLKLGIDATPNGAVIDAENNVSKSIYTIGGNLRGVLWETTAVPEIRGQGEQVAKEIFEFI